MQPPRGKPANLANSAKPAQTPTPLPIADETSTASPDAPPVVTQAVNEPTGPATQPRCPKRQLVSKPRNRARRSGATPAACHVSRKS